MRNFNRMEKYRSIYGAKGKKAKRRYLRNQETYEYPMPTLVNISEGTTLLSKTKGKKWDIINLLWPELCRPSSNQ